MNMAEISIRVSLWPNPNMTGADVLTDDGIAEIQDMEYGWFVVYKEFGKSDRYLDLNAADFLIPPTYREMALMILEVE